MGNRFPGRAKTSREEGTSLAKLSRIQTIATTSHKTGNSFRWMIGIIILSRHSWNIVCLVATSTKRSSFLALSIAEWRCKILLQSSFHNTIMCKNRVPFRHMLISCTQSFRMTSAATTYHRKMLSTTTKWTKWKYTTRLCWGCRILVLSQDRR